VQLGDPRVGRLGEVEVPIAGEGGNSLHGTCPVRDVVSTTPLVVEVALNQLAAARDFQDDRAVPRPSESTTTSGRCTAKDSPRMSDAQQSSPPAHPHDLHR
jgi:hypothetical protein